MARAARQLELSGVFASAITPRRPGSRDPDFAGSLDLLDFLTDRGVRGICLLGSTGEFFDYDFAERQRLVYLGVKRSRVPLIAGVSHSTLAGAIQLGTDAISAGADGLLLMPPYYFRYRQPEIEEFYLQFADEIGDAVPLLLHNAPQFTSRLEVATVRRLLGTGAFAGIEDTSGDWDYFEQLLALKRDLKDERPFALFAGHDSIAARALREGADGLMTGSACAVPELLVAVARQPAAEALNARLLEFAAWMERFPTPVAIKQAVELRGQKSGPPLTPLSPESRQTLAEFCAWFKAWLPGMQEECARAGAGFY